MTVIKQDDLIQSVADALQFISYYHCSIRNFWHQPAGCGHDGPSRRQEEPGVLL